jgi:hypothetical protein
LPVVICVVSFMSSDIVHTPSPPLRSDVKTIFVPSGLKRGCASYAIPEVRAVARPPAAGIV